ncbi:MAG: type II CRISPR RNA-guided endonuclease Cas9 [Metamycoplasmataceae bacterium]
MQKKKLNIGFDIGTTSVGYCLMEDGTNNIIKMGVRLFEDVASSKDGKLKSGKRREARSTRRRLNRLKIRKEDLIKWFVRNNFSSSVEEVKNILESYDITKYNVSNPIELKVKALKEKVSKNELIIILFHYIQHRGFFYLTQEMLNDQEKNETIGSKKEFPSVMLYNFWKVNGFYKGIKESSKISAHEYEKEIEEIFKTQKLDKELLESYLNIFMRVREYSAGPGSEKSPTPYGLFRIDSKTNTVKKIGDNLWDALIGKCTYYPNEDRGGAGSPIAEVFNLLNEINNIYFYNEKTNKLSEEQKRMIFQAINDSINGSKPTKKDVSLKLIVKSINSDDLTIDDISGYPINKDRKENFTSLKNYSSIAKWLKSVKLLKNIDLFDDNIIKKANEVFTKLQKELDVNRQFNILNNYLKDNSITKDNTLENKKLLKDITSLSKTHSLSYKAMIEYINHGIDHSENQMVYFSNMFPSKVNERFKNRKYIPTGIFDEEIISPTTRRAFNQNVAVMNKIIKFYSNEYDINNITFELPRDKNSAEERNAITKSQKNNENFGKKINQEFSSNWEEFNAKTKLKIKLWKQQDCKDIYDSKFIPFEDVVAMGKYEVDHIIPFSICAIDAMYNKVLTKVDINKEKGNRTPWQYLSKNGSFEKFEQLTLDLYSKKLIDKNKRDLLLFKNNPLTEMQQFIERNLVDTRYAARVVLNIFDEFFKSNKEIYPNAKIKVINGAMTNYARYNQFFIKKDRDDYTHHAVDAAIISYLGSHNRIQKLVKYKDGNVSNYANMSQKDEEFLIVDKETGEIIDLTKDKLEKNQDTENIRNQINELVENNKIFLSRMMITKNNMKLFDETIYSIRWNGKDKKSGYQVRKLDLIESSNLADYFDNDLKNEKKYSSLFCYQNDRVLYDKLNIIYNQFKSNNSKENPFLIYMKEKMGITNCNFILIEDQKIKSLKYKGDERDALNVIKLKSHNNNAIQSSLNMIGIRIYENTKGGLITIPLNIKVLKTVNNILLIDDDKLNDVLLENKIENTKKFMEIKNGTIFINKNNEKLFYAIGGGQWSKNQIEIKPIFTNTEKYFSIKRKNITISTLSNEYDLCKLDVLGNVYERSDLSDFFKN